MAQTGALALLKPPAFSLTRQNAGPWFSLKPPAFGLVRQNAGPWPSLDSPHSAPLGKTRGAFGLIKLLAFGLARHKRQTLLLLITPRVRPHKAQNQNFTAPYNSLRSAQTRGLGAPQGLHSPMEAWQQLGKQCVGKHHMPHWKLVLICFP